MSEQDSSVSVVQDDTKADTVLFGNGALEITEKNLKMFIKLRPKY